MTVSPNVSDHSRLIFEPSAGLGTSPSWSAAERDDANDYAAYWRARSGLFPRHSERDCQPDHE